MFLLFVFLRSRLLLSNQILVMALPADLLARVAVFGDPNVRACLATTSASALTEILEQLIPTVRLQFCLECLDMTNANFHCVNCNSVRLVPLDWSRPTRPKKLQFLLRHDLMCRPPPGFFASMSTDAKKRRRY